MTTTHKHRIERFCSACYVSLFFLSPVAAFFLPIGAAEWFGFVGVASGGVYAAISLFEKSDDDRGVGFEAE